jgi:hypothetical protein
MKLLKVTKTYYSPRTRKITNLFKHTNIGITFRSNNTLQQLTNQKRPVICRNWIRAVFRNLRVTPAKWHILDKQAAASDRDIRNIQDI